MTSQVFLTEFEKYLNNLKNESNNNYPFQIGESGWSLLRVNSRGGTGYKSYWFRNNDGNDTDYIFRFKNVLQDDQCFRVRTRKNKEREGIPIYQATLQRGQKSPNCYLAENEMNDWDQRNQTARTGDKRKNRFYDTGEMGGINDDDLWRQIRTKKNEPHLIYQFAEGKFNGEDLMVKFLNWMKSRNAVKRGEPIPPNDNNRGAGNNAPMNCPCNIILYGPPGTGKTYATIDISASVIANQPFTEDDEIKGFDSVQHGVNKNRFNENLGKRIHFITFHQNYSYEEFIGGIRPVLNHDENGGLQFEWKPGIFLKACAAAYKLANGQEIEWISQDDVDGFLNYCGEARAVEDIERIFKNKESVVLIIDEINRANISRVFGELITLIEEDKRLGGGHGMRVELPNGKLFGVPANLIIIGTMNTADKSIALLDVALRRRFEFYPMYPDENKIRDDQKERLVKAINKKLSEKFNSSDYNIGHSFFMNDNNLKKIMNKKIIPLLYEYFMNDEKAIRDMLSGENGWEQGIRNALHNLNLQVSNESSPIKIEPRNNNQNQQPVQQEAANE